MRTGRGMLLGKFLPPHRGHVYLVEFAAARPELNRIMIHEGTTPSERPFVSNRFLRS